MPVGCSRAQAELDSTDHDPTTILVGVGFAFLFLCLSGAYLATALARRKVLTSGITPTTLEVIGKHEDRVRTELTVHGGDLIHGE